MNADESKVESKRAWLRGVRVGVGAVAAVAVAAGVVLAVGAPLPALTREPVVIDARPGAADSTVACPGPVLAAGRNRAAAGEVTVAAPVSIEAGAAAGREGVEPRQEQLTATATGEDRVDAYIASPVDGARTDVAAAQSGSVNADDLTGFAAAACASPRFESWIVGGSAATGAVGLVLLANPSAVPAAVDVTVFGPDGARTPQGGSGITVPAQSQVLVPLAGIAEGDAAPVLRFHATGAPITAAMQVSATATLDPLGVDVVGVAAPPSPTQTIPGVVLPDSGSPDLPSSALVRVLSPAGGGTTTVIAYDESGREVASSGEVELTEGVPAEVTLAELPPGRITLEVDSEAPIVAAASTSRQVAGIDFAWFASAEMVQGVTVFAVPSGPRSVLSIVALQDEATEVALIRVSDGATVEEITVPAEGSVNVPIEPDEVYALDSPEFVHAAISFHGPNAISGYPLAPAAENEAAVSVIP